MWQINPPALVIMIYSNNISSGRGLEKRCGNPRRVGDIITEMFLGNSPLAKGYRKFIASKENSAEKGGEL
jgi:hypothetical protein